MNTKLGKVIPYVLLAFIVIGLVLLSAHAVNSERRPDLTVAIDSQGNLISFDLDSDGSLNAHSVRKILDHSWEPANPKICEDKIVVETVRGIYFINKYGYSKYQLTLGQSYKHPTCSPDGSQIMFDQDGMVKATDEWGTAIWEIGNGTRPLYSPVGILAWTEPNGDLVVEGKVVTRDAYAVNWVPDGSGIAFYRSHQVWIYYFQTGEIHPIYGQDITYGQGWSDSIYEIEETLWIGNTFIMNGSSPDRQSSNETDFDSSYVVSWLKN